jgi:hypothetical protein
MSLPPPLLLFRPFLLLVASTCCPWISTHCYH